MYEIKIRNWWKENPSWPDGLEPAATPWHKARKLTTCETEKQARAICMHWNANNKPGRYSRKAEFSKIEAQS